MQRIYETILKECKKQSLKYRSVAIRVLALLADEYNFQVYELFWTWFEKAFKQPVNILNFILKFNRKNFKIIDKYLHWDRKRFSVTPSHVFYLIDCRY